MASPMGQTGGIRLPNSVQGQVDLSTLSQDLAKYLPEHLLNSVQLVEGFNMSNPPMNFDGAPQCNMSPHQQQQISQCIAFKLTDDLQKAFDQADNIIL